MWRRKLLEVEAQLEQPINRVAGSGDGDMVDLSSGAAGPASSASTNAMSARPASQMPAGIVNAYAFQVCNTMSNSIVAGMPMLLFFKHFAASATILGIVIALPPLLNILQIPAAPTVDRVGYRAFVLRGWTIQCFIILGMSLVAWLPGSIERTTRLALMMLLLAGYNATRGYFTCGFLPWITQLIPASRRGRYVSLDQMSSQFALLGTMVGTAAFVKQAEGAAAFGQMFVVGCGAGLVSLWFLARIPNAAVPAPSRFTGAVRWPALAKHPPFARLVVFNIVILIALAGTGVCWVPLLRDVYGFQDWQFLALMAVYSAGTAVTLWGFGAVADRVGSKPLLGANGIILVAHLTLWGAVAAGVLAPTLWVTVLIQLSAAVGAALLTLPNTRLLMAVVPETGRNYFFAWFSVVTGLTAGVFPVAWGLVVDRLAGWKIRWGAVEWNQFSVCYALIIATYLLAQIFRVRLLEPNAVPTGRFLHELLVTLPRRTVARLLTRWPSAK